MIASLEIAKNGQNPFLAIFLGESTQNIMFYQKWWGKKSSLVGCPNDIPSEYEKMSIPKSTL